MSNQEKNDMPDMLPTNPTRRPGGEPPPMPPHRGPVPSGTPENSDGGPPWPVGPKDPPGRRGHELPNPPDRKPIRVPKKPEPDPGPVSEIDTRIDPEIDPEIAGR